MSWYKNSQIDNNMENQPPNNSRAFAEHQINAYKKLLKTLNDVSYGSWYISVTFNEPDENMVRKNFKESGPFNENFFYWLQKHWDYWQDKSNVSIELLSVSKNPYGKSSW